METLQEWLKPTDVEGVRSCTFGILVLELSATDIWFQHRFVARLNLDAYSYREGPMLIDVTGTERGVLEGAARILNLWEPDKIRAWADGLDELQETKKGARSALTRLDEDFP